MWVDVRLEFAGYLEPRALFVHQLKPSKQNIVLIIINYFLSVEVGETKITTNDPNHGIDFGNPGNKNRIVEKLDALLAAQR